MYALCVLLLPMGCVDATVPQSCGAGGPAPRRAVGWLNEPAGLPVLSDEPFDALSGNGWRLTPRQTINGSGVSLAIDSTAPLSPPHVVRFTYGIGFPGGQEPGVEAFDPALPVREAYFGVWWKPSNPWQNHVGSGVNKIAYLFSAVSAGDIALIMFNADTSYTIQVVPEFPVTRDVRRLAPNVTATPVTLGVWHQIEWHVRYSSTPVTSDGVTEWWLDGVLQGRYTDLRMSGLGVSEYQIAPTWGGVGDEKSEVDMFCFDHARVSGR
jgi:hypothetical protein